MSRILIILAGVFSLAGQPVETYLTAAHKAEGAGDFATAEREYESAVAVRPDAATWQRLGLVRHLQNKADSAIPAFERALQLDPELWSAHLFLGIDLYRVNRFDRALVELTHAAKLQPDDSDTRFWLGLTYLARKDYLPGFTLLEKLSQEQPKNIEILRILAENYALYGTALLNQVADRYPDTAAGLHVHAQALEFEGANAAALDVYNEIERRAPGRTGVEEAILRLKTISAAPRPPSSRVTDGGSPIPR